MKTNDNFWDCECSENYIHPITQEHCSICGCYESDQPSSRQVEIDYFRALAHLNMVKHYLEQSPKHSVGVDLIPVLGETIRQHYEEEVQRDKGE